MRLMKIYYKSDWEQNETYVYNNEGIYIPIDENAIAKFSYNIELTEVPEGKHYITVHAVEWGAYINNLFVHMFSINGSSSFYFIIDVSPSVSVLSLRSLQCSVGVHDKWFLFQYLIQLRWTRQCGYKWEHNLEGIARRSP
jgi:hypothetical protein